MRRNWSRISRSKVSNGVASSSARPALFCSCSARPRPAGSSNHRQQVRFIGRTRTPVSADVDGGTQRDGRMVGTRRIDRVHAEFVERTPVRQRHRRIHERRLDGPVQCGFLWIRQLRHEVRNHGVVTGENALLRAHLEQPPIAVINDAHATRAFNRLRVMMHTEDDRVQPNANRSACAIQQAIVDPRGHKVFDRRTRHRGRNQSAHQGTRDGRVAVGEMQERGSARVDVTGRCIAHTRDGSFWQPQSLEARHLDSPGIQGADGIDSDTPPSLREGLVDRENRRIDFDDVAQIAQIAHAQQSFLLGARLHAGEIVGFSGLDALHVALGCGR